MTLMKTQNINRCSARRQYQLRIALNCIEPNDIDVPIKNKEAHLSHLTFTFLVALLYIVVVLVVFLVLGLFLESYKINCIKYSFPLIYAKVPHDLPLLLAKRSRLITRRGIVHDCPRCKIHV